MKNIPLDTVKSFIRDRTMVMLAGSLLVVAIAYIIYVTLALEPSDLQVATRYTAFGDTHFYRNKWYYLLSFILFSVVLLGLHIAFAVKLYGRQQKQLAIALLSFTFLMFVVGWIITGSVLQIAFL